MSSPREEARMDHGNVLIAISSFRFLVWAPRDLNTVISCLCWRMRVRVALNMVALAKVNTATERMRRVS